VALSSSWHPRQVSAPSSLYCVPAPATTGADAAVAAVAADATGAEAAPDAARVSVWAGAVKGPAKPASPSSAQRIGLEIFIGVCLLAYGVLAPFAAGAAFAGSAVLPVAGLMVCIATTCFFSERYGPVGSTPFVTSSVLVR